MAGDGVGSSVNASAWVLGPAMSSLAASYATLSLGAGGVEIGIVLAGLALAAAVAVLWVARQAGREPVVAGLATA